MLEIDVLAKKLLANQTCNNCMHSLHSMNIIRCKKGDIASFCPEEGTCEDWVEGIVFAIPKKPYGEVALNEYLVCTLGKI